ncbi:hypothetical protein SAMN05444266_106458 [Chitinophaga jiangningensis]|uniref:Uncharacterized protein n=1 Tax=Chitinophaga jiangningensis TaxID=1419482 RepID=A0A1M7GAG5_9BACT|nr:hypothetical protein SAMN05444266_106458 [Chitinophaga jiangningensis]
MYYVTPNTIALSAAQPGRKLLLCVFAALLAAII